MGETNSRGYVQGNGMDDATMGLAWMDGWIDWKRPEVDWHNQLYQRAFNSSLCKCVHCLASQNLVVMNIITH